MTDKLLKAADHAAPMESLLTPMRADAVHMIKHHGKDMLAQTRRGLEGIVAVYDAIIHAERCSRIRS